MPNSLPLVDHMSLTCIHCLLCVHAPHTVSSPLGYPCVDSRSATEWFLMLPVFLCFLAAELLWFFQYHRLRIRLVALAALFSFFAFLLSYNWRSISNAFRRWALHV